MTIVFIGILSLLLAAICFFTGTIFVLFALFGNGNGNGCYLVPIGMALLLLASVCAARVFPDSENLEMTIHA